MKGEPFYSSGLKFSCKRCSSCCRYDEGYVFLTENDLFKLTSCFKMDKDSFIGTYCRWIDKISGKKALSLKEKTNKDCVFWDNGCICYEARPVQCRVFPFWDSIVASKYKWDIASSGCPGMNNGFLYSKDAIEALLKMYSDELLIYRGG